ncbi:MAG: ion transporter [Caldilineaceae bacterium]|nr:ion transporter [Caldilineaceae bacterium]
MKAKTAKHRELKSIGYELFIGALSILSIVNLVLMYAFVKDQNLQYVLLIMNAIMTPIFLGDFIYRILTSEARSTYFFRGFGWADLLSSLPFPQLKILRLFRLWRVIRLFMEFGAGNLIHEFVTHRAQNALLTVVFLVLCVLEFGSLAMLAAERSAPDANITNAEDAIWWAYVTITTVGYGDFYPVSASGRLVGIFVMTAGVGLFGTLSGFLANTFLSPNKPKKEAQDGNGHEAQANDAKTRLALLLQKVETQEQALVELKAELTQLDELL